MKNAVSAWVCFFALLCASFALSQENGEAEDPAAGYPELLKQWEELDQQLGKKFEALRLADDAGRKELLPEYVALLAQSNELLPKLERAALAKFASMPAADPKLTRLLLGLLANNLRADRVDEAFQIGKTLIDAGVEEKHLPTLAGVAAYNSDHYEEAAAWLAKAKENDALNQESAALLAGMEETLELWNEEQAIREKQTKANNLPWVKLQTSEGDIVVELFEEEAPQTVGNFISLVKSGFYDGLSFHRVLPGFMAQGGDPKGDGTGGPGYKIFCECSRDNHRKHFRGTLSMAHAGPNTGGSQFFLTFRRTEHLDGRHTVFGRVLRGWEVLAKLQRIDPSRPAPGIEPSKIIKAEVIRDRGHEYKPTKVN